MNKAKSPRATGRNSSRIPHPGDFSGAADSGALGSKTKRPDDGAIDLTSRDLDPRLERLPGGRAK